MFQVTDKVKVVGPQAHLGSGRITNISDAVATVKFKIPNQPNYCSDCGSPAHLSVNGGTGEVICMKSGCGYNHGFKEKVMNLNLAHLENLTVKSKLAEKERLYQQIKSLVADGARKRYFDPKKAIRALGLLKSWPD